jgi:ribosomal protein S18 acetylase RimI-like enzyme
MRINSAARKRFNRQQERCLHDATDNQQTIEIRDSVVPADCDAIRKIVERTGFFRPDEIVVAVKRFEERLARGPTSGLHFVFAEIDDCVIGYACFGPIACTVASFDLYWIAVDPKYQGQGIGRRLMADVEARIAEAGGQRLYVDTSGQPKYAPTRAFYEHNGYHCDARLADFYAPGDDRIIFVKVLAP